MSGHDIATVLDAHRAFEHAFYEVTEGIHDAANDTEDKPMVPANVGHQWANTHSQQNGNSHTEDGTLPGLSWRVALPHLM